MQSFFNIREKEKSETHAIFFKPLGLSKKFMNSIGKTKLDDGAKNHPFFKRQSPPTMKRKNTSMMIREH